MQCSRTIKTVCGRCLSEKLIIIFAFEPDFDKENKMEAQLMKSGSTWVSVMGSPYELVNDKNKVQWKCSTRDDMFTITLDSPDGTSRNMYVTILNPEIVVDDYGDIKVQLPLNVAADWRYFLEKLVGAAPEALKAGRTPYIPLTEQGQLKVKFAKSTHRADEELNLYRRVMKIRVNFGWRFAEKYGVSLYICPPSKPRARKTEDVVVKVEDSGKESGEKRKAEA